MFNKVLSNLAFSPSSIDQLAFYANRLKKEQAIRRLGLILIIFSMFIQLFAAMIPPEKSLAASENDVIKGGVTNISQLKAKHAAHSDVRELYKRFGLTANDFNNAKNTTFKFQEQGKKGTRTVGRINFTYTDDNYLGVFGGSRFYSRSASEWKGSEPAYYFDKHQGTDGNYYYIWVLKNCGNIAYRKAEPPAKPKPKPEKKPEPAKPAPKPTITPTVTVEEPKPVQQPEPEPEKPVEQPKPEPEPEPEKPVCENNPKLKPDDILCKCIENPTITADDPRCTSPGKSKKAENVTQRLSSAKTTSTKAKPGDVIEYTLTTKNTNVAAKTDVTVEDYVGDVLDYADLDRTYLAAQGGVYVPETKMVRWTNQKIGAKDDLKHQFRVVVKSVIPSTNQPNATATDYDCKMQNGYGTETTIPVACAPVKEIEHLPNTGPGTTAAISFTIATISGYFFMRNRLLSKEVKIVKRNYQNAGM